MPLLRNLGTLTSWNPLGHSRPVMGLLYLYLYCFIFRRDCNWSIFLITHVVCVSNSSINHMLMAHKHFYMYFCISCCRYMYALNYVSFYRSTFCSLACYSKHHQIPLWLVMEYQFLQCLFVHMNYAFLSFLSGSLF